MDENYNIQCGEVFLHLLHGTLTFNCTLCEGKYQGFTDYSFHVASEHSPFLAVESPEEEEEEDAQELEIKEERIDDDDDEENQFDENSLNSFVDEFEFESLNETEIERDELEEEEEMFVEYSEPDEPNTKQRLIQIEKAIQNEKLSKHERPPKNEKKIQPGKKNQIVQRKQLKREIKKEKTNEPEERVKRGKEWPDLSSGARPVRIRYINKDDERIHSCPECDFTCKLLRNLKGHMRRHVIEKPFPCNQCEKGFYTTTELNVHMRFHTGERPYLCTVCGARFITNTKLRSHAKIHQTNEQTFKSETSSKADTPLKIYQNFIENKRSPQKRSFFSTKIKRSNN